MPYAAHQRRCFALATTTAVVTTLLVLARTVAANSEPRGYVAEQWAVEDGLPNNALTSVLQAQDGFIWVASWAGVARFDGVHFTRVADNLPNDHARALVEDADGTIWIGLSGTGVARWHPDGVDLFTPAHGLAGVDVRALALDEGRVWVATENGLSVIDDARVTTWRAQDGLPTTAVTALSRRPGGGVWVTTANGLCQTSGLSVRCAPSARVLGAALETRDGRLWVGTDRGLLSGEPTLGGPLACRNDCFARRTVTALLEARDGALWVGFADGGLVHSHEGIQTSYGAADGLAPGGPVVAFAEDEEGSVWAAISGSGLARLSRKRVHTLTSADGLPPRQIGSIVQDAAGTIWAGADCGPVSELQDGRFYRRFVEYTKDSCAYVLLSARDGALWIGTTDRGVFRWHGGEMAQFDPSNGLSDASVRGLFEDRDGVVWIGTSVGGLHYYSDASSRAASVRRTAWPRASWRASRRTARAGSGSDRTPTASRCTRAGASACSTTTNTRRAGACPACWWTAAGTSGSARPRTDSSGGAPDDTSRSASRKDSVTRSSR